tara:strand:- start:754 stop:1956 length:1203 start_codon:yes stop_codon:yes gene_type:complete
VYFQALDDKKTCVGIYHDGNLIFDESKFPESFKDSKTWRYSGFLDDDSIDYGWILSEGSRLESACPEDLEAEFKKVNKKMLAFKKSFELAKISFKDHCFFDLVPHDFLCEFLELKNQITKHVFETYEKQDYYDHLVNVEKLLYKIRYQSLNVNTDNCRGLFVNSISRNQIQKIMKGNKTIDYNIFGTRTGRLSTFFNSFPMLTMRKEIRALVKPHNDWFISLDYNGAEVRTVMALLEIEQPEDDVHEWNIKNILKKKGITDRENAKTFFFSWLYNPDSKKIENTIYNRELLNERYYHNGYVCTPFGREILVNDYKSVNYLVQSTTADLVNDRAVALDKFLKDKKTFISHIVHDEVVLDMPDSERYLIPEIKKIFSQNSLAEFKTNLRAGKDYYDIGVLNL